MFKLLTFTGNGFPFHTCLSFSNTFLSYLLFLAFTTDFFHLEMLVSVTWGTNGESAL